MTDFPDPEVVRSFEGRVCFSGRLQTLESPIYEVGSFKPPLLDCGIAQPSLHYSNPLSVRGIRVTCRAVAFV